MVCFAIRWLLQCTQDLIVICLTKLLLLKKLTKIKCYTNTKFFQHKLAHAKGFLFYKKDHSIEESLQRSLSSDKRIKTCRILNPYQVCWFTDSLLCKVIQHGSLQTLGLIQLSSLSLKCAGKSAILLVQT